MRPKVRVLCLPDVDRAIGGVKQLYRHVEHLVALGWDAAMVTENSGFRPSWFTSTAPSFSFDECCTFNSFKTSLFKFTLLFFDKLYDNSGGETAGYADSVIVSGQVNMHASHTFTVTTDYGDGDDGLFESSPGVATLNKVSELSLRSRSKAIDALKMVDKALDKIHMERAKLGAVMSRMDQAIDNLTNVSANTSSARSRIMDADMAAEAGNLTKTQILQQSAMAMIAQASKAQQAVLTLLQG